MRAEISLVLTVVRVEVDELLRWGGLSASVGLGFDALIVRHSDRGPSAFGSSSSDRPQVERVVVGCVVSDEERDRLKL